MKKNRRVSRRLFRRLIRWWPRKKTLKGSWAHKILGESIFHPDIWKFSAKSVAGGVALGLFIAVTPTVPVQMLMAAVLSYVLKVNMPAALAMCWTTNPLTFPLLFWIEYKIGDWILSVFSISDFSEISQDISQDIGVKPIDIPDVPSEENRNFLDNMMGKVPTLILGSFVFAIIVSAISYFSVLWSYKWWPIPKKWKNS